MQIKITDSAITRIKQLAKKNNYSDPILRVTVDSGGCSGFMYEYKLAESLNKDDYVLEKDGIKVLVDPMSQAFLDNCIVDFTQELGSSYFNIINPMAASKCGCGNSFAI